jgi:hypothetical protein
MIAMQCDAIRSGAERSGRSKDTQTHISRRGLKSSRSHSAKGIAMDLSSRDRLSKGGGKREAGALALFHTSCAIDWIVVLRAYGRVP